MSSKKNQKINDDIYKKVEQNETSKEGATTTHIFKSLMRMLSSVDPATLQRTRDRFLKKHNPNHKTSQKLKKDKESLNEIAILNSFNKIFLNKSKKKNYKNSSNRKHSNQLFSFIANLKKLKTKNCLQFDRTITSYKYRIPATQLALNTLKEKLLYVTSSHLLYIVTSVETHSILYLHTSDNLFFKHLYTLNSLYCETKRNFFSQKIKNEPNPIRLAKTLRKVL